MLWLLQPAVFTYESGIIMALKYHKYTAANGCYFSMSVGLEYNSNSLFQFTLTAIACDLIRIMGSSSSKNLLFVHF